ncbi:MAG: topoisomerase DNA-binding C4 zinc finger domain-containing protein, partial [Solobacterium sp.]|nr:topoisomerase DNA-binding C4 zinc finger domain-containing protein [Solobacterium sp.]
ANEIEILRNFWERFTPLVERAYADMEKLAPEKVGEICPDCGSELVYRNGRFGRFISCSNFPKCRYTRKIEVKEKEKPEPTGKMCPDCGHELLKRKSRFGTYFLGCSNFPACHYMENLNGERIISKKDRKASAEGDQKPAAKKSTAKKTTAKKTAAKKTAAKKTAGRKTSSKKTSGENDA